MKSGAVFFDRDGTINKEAGYIDHPDRFEVYPFTPNALKIVNELGFKVIIVTNQSGIARGYLDENILKDLHKTMVDRIASAGAVIDAIYYCPHHPTEGRDPYVQKCTCRKPNTGMIEQAVSDHKIDLEKSYMVGDRFKDIQVAKKMNLTSALVMTGYGKGEYVYQRDQWPFLPDMTGENILVIANQIKKKTGRKEAKRK
jgi:D-glycero-D-manno-heptose 1,7-bisphosphate phosphatase